MAVYLHAFLISVALDGGE